MGKKCLKCGYIRNNSDTTPDFECPKCGAIYAKVEAALSKSQQNNGDGQSDAEKILAIKRKSAVEQQKPLEPPKDRNTVPQPKQAQQNTKLAKCKTCGNEVSKTAKICPHCGEKNPAPTQQVGCLSAIVIIFIVLWIIGKIAGTGGISDGTSGPRYDQFSAQVECENFTKKRLKAPSTADFAPHSDLKISGAGTGPWTVVGYVDAQNSYGAKIRQTYICQVHFQGDMVYLDSLTIN